MKKSGILTLKSSTSSNSKKLFDDKFKSFIKNKKHYKNKNSKFKNNDTKANLNENEKKRRLEVFKNVDNTSLDMFKNFIKKPVNTVVKNIKLEEKPLIIKKKTVNDKHKKSKDKFTEKINKLDNDNFSQDIKKNKKQNNIFEPSSIEEIIHDEELKELNIEKDILNFIKKPKKQKRNIISKNQKSKFVSKSIIVSDSGIFCSDLAHRMQVDIEKVLHEVENLKGEKNVEKLNKEEAEIIIKEFGHRPIFNEVDQILYDESDKKYKRPPIISIMGHIDHGKTSIIDRMRKTSIVSNEFGGITQKISAYTFDKDGKQMTLVDTPGHEIFKEMRVNGAQFTDIIVLVIAADDGVKDQTIESIKYAQESSASIIVVINKIDKRGSDKNKIKRELMNNGIIVESMGGEILEVEVSAKTGEGFDALYEAIFLQSDLLDLKTHHGRANGIVIDSFIKKGQGIVTTVILKDGVIKNKDLFISNNEVHKVKHLFCESKNYKKCMPSSAISILGFNKVGNIGDTFHVIDNEKQAKLIFIDNKKEDIEIKRSLSFLEEKNLNLIIKGNTSASISAIKEGIQRYVTDDINVKILYSGIGNINEGDYVNAKTCNAQIIGFFVKNDYKQKDLYPEITVNIYNIIYELIDYLHREMKRIIGDKFKEDLIGRAKITHIFDMKDNNKKIFRVSGGVVTYNVIKNEKDIIIRVIRNKDVFIQEATITSLEMRRISVNEVKEKQEFGMVLKDHHNVEVGDVIECIKKTKID